MTRGSGGRLAWTRTPACQAGGPGFKSRPPHHPPLIPWERRVPLHGKPRALKPGNAPSNPLMSMTLTLRESPSNVELLTTLIFMGKMESITWSWKNGIDGVTLGVFRG
jgi:hypothetical protein